MRIVRRRGFDWMNGKSGGNALPIVQVKEARYSATCKAEIQSCKKRGSGAVLCFTRVLGITRMSTRG
jgi:hypothetical protein